MGIFRRNNLKINEENQKTPVKFNRREKVVNKPKRKKIKRIIIGVFVVVVLGITGFFGFKTWETIKKVFADDGNGILNLFTGSPTQQLRGEANGRVNILILGVGDKGHDGADLSDTIMVASYDVKTKSIAFFSIPRDLYVQIPKNGYSKINAAHAYGEQNKYPGGGPALAQQTVQNILDIPIHYYVRVDFSGLRDVVDAVGGVEVDVENSFCDYNYPVEYKGDTSTICFTAGKQRMNGTKALQFARSRHSLQSGEGSDFARSKRQQKIIAAIKDKIISAGTYGNPKKIVDLMSAIGNHAKTDFNINEMSRLYDVWKSVGNRIINKSFDSSPEGLLTATSSETTGYILEPRTGNFKEIQAVVKNVFIEATMRHEKAAVSIYNGTWNTGLATRLSEEFKKAGYNITFSGDGDNKNITKTQIIDYTNGAKPATVKCLENKFHVTATKQTDSSAGVDIKVVVGKDYKE